MINSPPRAPTEIRVKEAMFIMETSLPNGVSLQQVAHEVNLSLSRLRHLFKAEIGVTPAQYLKFLKMRHAKELAATTFLTVKEIVTKLHVSDQSHFLRDFKRTFGATVTECRQQRSQIGH